MHKTSERPAIPFLNLAATNRRLAAEIAPVWRALLESADFIGGEPLATFEREFSLWAGANHTVGVANGTDALIIGLQALEVGRGDEVIVPAHTFVATVEAIERAGAVPVLADVDGQTATLDPAAVEAAITPRTAAIVPVHLYGQPADMAALRALAGRHGLVLLEDAAQAHGARYGGVPVGSLGDAAAFSFYPGKNLGACGDAGALTTNDPDVARRARMIGDHGQTQKYRHEISGLNSRLDALQAAALSVKLRHVSTWNERRTQVAARYSESLAGLDVVPPATAADRTHVFHLYVIRHPERDRLFAELADARVGVGLHYPTPVHLQPAFAHLGAGSGDYPQSEAWAAECLSLPMCPELTDGQVDMVVERLAEVI